MDGISSTVVVEFSDLRADQSDLRDDAEILLRIVGAFRVTVGDLIVYEEDEFTVVEFAAAVAKWLIRVVHEQQDFNFESMESEDIGLIWIKNRGRLWEIGSTYQQPDFPRLSSLDAIITAFRDFMSRLRSEVLLKFDIDIQRVIAAT